MTHQRGSLLRYFIFPFSPPVLLPTLRAVFHNYEKEFSRVFSSAESDPNIFRRGLRTLVFTIIFDLWLFIESGSVNGKLLGGVGIDEGLYHKLRKIPTYPTHLAVSLCFLPGC